MLRVTYTGIPQNISSRVRYLFRWISICCGAPFIEEVVEGQPSVSLRSKIASVVFPLSGHSTAEGQLVESNFIFLALRWLTGEVESAWKADRFGHHTITDDKDLRIIRDAGLSGFCDKLKKKLFPDDKELEPLWPDGKRWAVGLSHDVDYPEVVKYIEPLRIFKRNGFIKMLKASPGLLCGRLHHWHFSSIVELERKFSVKSAFYFCPVKGNMLAYVLGRPDPFYDIETAKFLELFGLLRKEGYEIGMHASYRAGDTLSGLQAEKEKLEAACQINIRGMRHHYWKLGPIPEKTLRLHPKAGFLYDTSLGFEKYLGWRRGVCLPFFPLDQSSGEEIETLQLGTTWMDDHLQSYLHLNACGFAMGKTSDLRTSILDHFIDKTRSLGGLMMTDIHEYTFDKTLFADWQDTYSYFLNKIYEDRSVWCARPVDIATHWISRRDRIKEKSRLLRP